MDGWAMSRGRVAIAADIPPSLKRADEVLSLYGRWAMSRAKSQCCGSAEGRYRAPANDDDRQPRELIMPVVDALAAQRALARVPEQERKVLAILYVPNRLPAEAQLRIAMVPPRLSQERHLAGLRMFNNIYGKSLYFDPPDNASAHRQPIG